MATRRQEKVARVVRQAVSDAVSRHLGDPRIEGFISITRVEMSADLRIADVYMSIFGGSQAAQNKTFAAIKHARVKIQSILAETMQSKFCPVLRFYLDEKFKKTLETMNLIEKAASEYRDRESVDQTQDQT